MAVFDIVHQRAERVYCERWHEIGNELPRKSFTATPGFEEYQTGEGLLTVPFEMGRAAGRRMIVPTQIWMLQRMGAAMAAADQAELADWLKQFSRGEEILTLDEMMADCRIDKQGGRCFPCRSAGRLANFRVDLP